MDISTIVFLAIFGFIIFMIFSKFGKQVMFGGKILSTHEHEIIRESGMTKTTIKVHSIQKKSGEKCIGIEISEKAKLGFSVYPITLSKSEAKELISMLDNTANLQ